MRGDALLTLRLLLRRDGLAGLAAALGGAAIATAATLPWTRLVTDVTMLDRSGTRIAASAGLLPTRVAGWLLLAVGCAALVAGALLAIDRPLPAARLLLVTAGALALAVGGAALASLLGGGPPPAELAAELLGLPGQLPVGVELELRARVGPGAWVAAAGAGATVGGALAARPG